MKNKKFIILIFSALTLMLNSDSFAALQQPQNGGRSTAGHTKNITSRSKQSFQANRGKQKTAAKVQAVAANHLKNPAPQPPISRPAFTHIQARHWYNAQQGANTSHFAPNMSKKKLDLLARATIKNGSIRPSAHGQGRLTYQHHFFQPIGTTTSGQQAYSLRVVTDQQNNVITAFPVR